jgi:hypothetical protein
MLVVDHPDGMMRESRWVLNIWPEGLPDFRKRRVGSWPDGETRRVNTA